MDLIRQKGKMGKRNILCWDFIYYKDYITINYITINYITINNVILTVKGQFGKENVVKGLTVTAIVKLGQWLQMSTGSSQNPAETAVVIAF